MFEQQIEAPIYVNREVYVMTCSGSYKKQQRFKVTSQIQCIMHISCDEKSVDKFNYSLKKFFCSIVN